MKNLRIACALLAGALLAGNGALSQESAVAIPRPTLDAKEAAGRTQTAVFAGGCFWGVQGVFQHVKGVRQVLSGYSGGERATAQYEVVSTGATGHAESVQVTFDPSIVSYGELLQVFFSVAHDPTQLNRQSPDVGTQYRSAIFFATEEQRKIAQAYVAQLDAAHVFAKPIVTRVDSLKQFYPAEDYHQDFLLLHPYHPYIVFNDLPKIDHLKAMLPALYQPTPVRVAAR